MKIIKLRRIIYVNFSIFAILLITILAISYKIYDIKSTSNQEIRTIKNETLSLKNEARKVRSQINDVKKYREIWDFTPYDKKSTAIIKSEDINQILDSVAQKHEINSHIIKMVLPVELKKGIFRGKAIKSFVADGELVFQAYDDIKAMSFIRDFTNQIPGNIILTSLRLKKTQPISNQQLLSISLGKNKGLIEGKLKFIWYSYRDKEIKKPIVK